MTTTAGRAARIVVPTDLRARARVGRIDYESAFTVAADPSDDRSAEQWARAMYESPPAAERLFVWYGWKALTARLGPFPSDDYVLGYRIETNEPDCIRFGVQWRLGLTAELVLWRGPSTATLASFVELGGAIARLVWPMAVPMHHLIVRRWLTRAARGGQR